MNLYMVRHGETGWNRANRLQGQHDVPLNSTGLAQANQLHQEIMKWHLKFDTVYASPLQRTLKTAQIIAPNQKIIVDHNLKERDIGQFAGQDCSVLFDCEIDFLDEALNSSAFGVEPIRVFQARATTFLTLLRANHPLNARILVVTSNGFMKRLHYALFPHLTPPNFQNAQLYHFEI